MDEKEKQTAPKLLDNHVYCYGCGRQVHAKAIACPLCGAPQCADARDSSHAHTNRYTAALLAFFLGWIGGHKFYLGRMISGGLYMLFCWSLIPAVIAIIEGIIYMSMSDESFQRKYGQFNKGS